MTNAVGVLFLFHGANSRSWSFALKVCCFFQADSFSESHGSITRPPKLELLVMNQVGLRVIGGTSGRDLADPQCQDPGPKKLQYATEVKRIERAC